MTCRLIANVWSVLLSFRPTKNTSPCLPPASPLCLCTLYFACRGFPMGVWRRVLTSFLNECTRLRICLSTKGVAAMVPLFFIPFSSCFNPPCARQFSKFKIPIFQIFTEFILLIVRVVKKCILISSLIQNSFPLKGFELIISPNSSIFNISAMTSRTSKKKRT